MTDEDAFWMAIGTNPADGLPRLVFADWLEESVGTVVCPKCVDGWLVSRTRVPEMGQDEYGESHSRCHHCSATGRVSDGRAELAAALRATADRVPRMFPQDGSCSWAIRSKGKGFHEETCLVNDEVCEHMVPAIPPWNPHYTGYWWDYPTAEAAIRDLCRSWVKFHHPEVAA